MSLIRDRKFDTFFCWVILTIALVGLPAVTQAQEGFPGFEQDGLGLGQFDDTPTYQLSGDFTVEKNPDANSLRSGSLSVTLVIKPGWHGYSQRKTPAQVPTEINVTKSDDFEIVGPFVPDLEPKKRFDDALGGELEEFEGAVTWTAPIEIKAGVDEKNLSIEIEVEGQVCEKERCVQFSSDEALFVAEFDRYTEPAPKGQTEFRAPGSHVAIKGMIDKTTVKPGGTINLKITATPDLDWHVYKHEYSQREDGVAYPTVIYFPQRAGWEISEAFASSKPIEKAIVNTEKVDYYHEGEVTWTIKLTAPADAKEGKYPLGGRLLYQACKEQCEMPIVVDFAMTLAVGSGESEAAAVGFVPSKTSYVTANEESAAFWASANSRTVAAIPFNQLLVYLGMAFVAGLILNIMPCVLPVIGLKVMSFVQQAGEKRGKIFLLNVVFSLGMLSVFWTLATLSAFFGMGWGDWLTKSMTGAIIITSVVFAFGLSMLGVWEIPIPGITGSSALGKKSQEEGLSGTFALGILTTILATPCTGPLLIPAIAITTGQPAWVSYSIFTAIGLGMALPYLLIGIFPSLISWLPKPGAWMNTFKQVSGFVLMGTVVFLLASFAEEPRNKYLVAVLSLLVVIALGCWWIGRTSLVAKMSEQLRAWGWGIGIITAGALVAFNFLVPSPYELDWQEFSKQKLGELRAESRIVFIDFTGPG